MPHLFKYLERPIYPLCAGSRGPELIVSAETRHGTVTALRIGIGNALRYFPRDKSVIELQLDHLGIQCVLPADFWTARPVISDRRLCVWLQAKRHGSGKSSLSLHMEPKGNNLFQLKPSLMSPRGRGKPPVARRLESILPHHVGGADAPMPSGRTSAVFSARPGMNAEEMPAK
jgi:hypothetical protein